VICKLFSVTHLPKTAVGHCKVCNVLTRSTLKCALRDLKYSHVIDSEASDSLRIM